MSDTPSRPADAPDARTETDRALDQMFGYFTQTEARLPTHPRAH